MNVIFFVVVGSLVVLAMAYSVVYYNLASDSFLVTRDPTRKNLSFTEALSASVSTQTLLGMGDITPASPTAQVIMMTQSSITLIVLLLLTTVRFNIQVGKNSAS